MSTKTERPKRNAAQCYEDGVSILMFQTVHETAEVSLLAFGKER